MLHETHAFKGPPVVTAALVLLLFCGHSSAEDSPDAVPQEDRAYLGLFDSSSSPNQRFDVTLGFAFEDRKFFDYERDNRNLEFQMDPFGTMGLHEPAGASTSAALKYAMREFGFLRPVKEVVDRAEARFENYERKMRLKGEIVFSGKAGPALAIEKRQGLNPDPEHGESPGLKSWLFSQKFMPQKLGWRFGLDPNDEIITGKFLIGDHISLEGNAGERNDVFIMFRYEF